MDNSIWSRNSSKASGERFCFLPHGGAILVQQGEFPAPLQIGKNRIAWRRSTIQAWIDNRPVQLTAVERARLASRKHKRKRKQQLPRKLRHKAAEAEDRP